MAMQQARFVRDQPEGALLRVKILPRASRTEVVGLLGEELKIKIAAPPVDSAANEALIRFLADRLGCPRRAIELRYGHHSPHKVLRLHRVTAAQAASRLLPAV